jgi:hypothetical protein
MKTNCLKCGLLLVISTLNAQLSTFGQGSLTPPGAPAATMKSLAQIEPRTPIASAPFTISVPGSYYLTTNLTVSSGTAITIVTNGVTLDLNGFTISSTAPSYGESAILLPMLVSDTTNWCDITICNGHIRSGMTNYGGIYSGSGFDYGIVHGAATPVNIVVSKVSVTGVRLDGIRLGNGRATVVEACTVTTAGNSGITASIIKGSVATNCSLVGIWGDQVVDCLGASSGNYGVYAISSAQNCSGYNGGGGTGLYATTAQNCYGSSASGTGLWADTAQNCSGSSSSGIGLRASDVAIGCKGNSSSGIGVQAYIANSCRVTGGTTNITFKYNMP